MLTWTTRTCPSCFGNISTTRPRCYCQRGAFWSITSTTSPTRKLSLASLHFVRVLSVARNSSLHRFHNIFTRFQIDLHRFLGLNPHSSATWGASCNPSWPTKKWFGVNTGSSRGSVPSYVRGIAFFRSFTSLKTVCSSSSVSPAFPTIAFRVFLATLITLISGGFQFHLMPLFAASSVILSRSID